MRAARRLLTIMHRWIGLASALFLVVVATTGSIIAVGADLQRLLAPDETVQPPHVGAVTLDWRSLHAIAELSSGGIASTMLLHRAPNAAVAYEVASPPGQPPLGFDTIVLDPYTGREIKRVTGGDLREGWSQFVPFVETLHVSLALGGWGTRLLGIVAAAWTLDCFVGLYLTLPPGRWRGWRSWGKAWRLKLPSPSAFRLNYDLHRAIGLWLWPMLFIFAWSGVGFNLPGLYASTMHALTGYEPVRASAESHRLRAQRIDWDGALTAARRAAAEASLQRGFTIQHERELRYLDVTGTYALGLRTSRDRSDDHADSWVTVDAATGKLLGVELPTGERAGNTIDTWLGLLHEAMVFGLPYRILVCASGLLIVTITITGIVIWVVKRRASAVSRSRPQWGGNGAQASSAGTSDR